MARRLPSLVVAAALAGCVALAAPAPGAAAEGLAPLPPQPAGVAWPTRAWPEGAPHGVVPGALDAAVGAVFQARGRSGVPDTRALLVVQGGRLVVERYADGFDRDTRFQSWSMAKSVTQALVATLVRDGRLRVEAPAPVPAWQGAGDPRAALTLDELLRFSTGLANADGLGGDPAESFVARMLFGPGAEDVAGFAEDAGLAYPPGSHWAYSTGTSTILAAIVGSTVGRGEADTLHYAREELLGPLGMRSAVLEFDAAGTFLGGGFVWASARDWARFGYLYLRDGVWDGVRHLPAGWVDYTRTPGTAANNGSYGAQFWLNLTPAEHQPPRFLPGGPVSAFAAVGNGGQYVIVVPTRDLVLVRLGELGDFARWAELARELGAIVAPFPAIAPETEAPE